MFMVNLPIYKCVNYGILIMKFHHIMKYIFNDIRSRKQQEDCDERAKQSVWQQPAIVCEEGWIRNRGVCRKAWLYRI